MQQTFQVGPEPRVNFIGGKGDLEVIGWDKREISLEWEGQTNDLHQEGNSLTLTNSDDDVKIWTPYDTDMRVENLKGDVEVRDIRRIELKDVKGDVELTNIGADANLENIGEAVSLENIDGDLTVQKASSVRARRKIGGDADLHAVPLVEIEMVGGDLDLREAEMASIGAVGGDLDVTDLSEALRCGNVGGDGQISASSQTEITLGNIGGDLEISSAALVQLGNIGGDGDVRDVKGNVQIGNMGGDASIIGVGGDLTIGRVGSDAELRELQGSIRIGAVGGDLDLQATFPAGSQASLHVGGDAEVSLPSNANLTLQATVGGSVSGPAISFGGGGNLVRLVYGEGTAQCNLSVGGDLDLRNGGTPQVSSASMPWGNFGQEMAQLGQNMAQMGQELGREFHGIFSDMGTSWGHDVTRKVEEQMRKARHKAEQSAHRAEEQARRAEERARRMGRRTDRMYVRVNEREWQMNPDRINDLVNRAQQAAMEGVAGAMEAVERSLQNLRMPHSPQPPYRPYQPVPPMPPVPPVPPMGFPPQPPTPKPPTGFSSSEVPSGQTRRFEESGEDQGSQAEEPNREQEREAILRMIAEGRITPEEGDMLLEGLNG